VYGVFSVQQPLEEGVKNEIEQGKAIADVAKRSGVKHFVYCSYGSADVQPGVPFIDSKWEIEQYIRTIGLVWTIFRPVFFMEYFLKPEVQDSIYNGKLRVALDSEMELQMIAVDDIGAFVALAFNNPDYFAGKALEIAGDVKTGNEIAKIFSRAIGREVVYEQADIDEVRGEGSDFAMLFDWLNKQGFSADILMLKEIYPGLKSFETWVNKTSWHKAAA
jgi:uncharacterized protein YbjT (DUF2867 family)